MNLPALATLLLCLFASLLAVVRPAPRRRAMPEAALAFIAGGVLAALLQPGAPLLALCAGVLSALSLLRPLRPAVAVVLAGLCTGFGVVGLFPMQEYGPAALLAWVGGLAAPLVALRLAARRARFAPAPLIDQGQCGVVIAAPVVAALPGAGEGWRSALALAGASSDTAGVVSPGLWLLVPLAALAAGMLHQAWSRR